MDMLDIAIELTSTEHAYASLGQEIKKQRLYMDSCPTDIYRALTCWNCLAGGWMSDKSMF